MLVVYLDDILITRNYDTEINKVKGFLNQKFTIKDLGNAKYFLGLELARSEDGLFVNQRKYAMDLLQDAGMLGCKPTSTPFPKSCKLNEEDGELSEDPQAYRRLIGRLLYLGFIRPDLTYATQ